MSAKTITKIIASSSEACVVEATSDDTSSSLWFKTQPLDRTFCYRAIQLQLQTDSTDQGHDDSLARGRFSWFELAIYDNDAAEQPKNRDGKPCVWSSHWNRTDPQDTDDISRHFGYVFDRRHEIFGALKVGARLRWCLANCAEDRVLAWKCYRRSCLCKARRMA